MTYDPTLTAKENDEARSSGSVYTIEVKLQKSRFERFKAILNDISMDEHSVKSFYYGMKANLLYVVSGVIGLVTLTLWEPNLSIRSITLRAKHSSIAREHKLEAEKERVAKETALIEAIKEESKPKEPELSDEEKMEDWLKRYKES